MAATKILLRKKLLSQLEKHDALYLLSELVLSAFLAMGTNSRGLAPFGVGFICGISVFGEFPLIAFGGSFVTSLLLSDFGQAIVSFLFMLSLLFIESPHRKLSQKQKSVLLVVLQAVILPVFYGFSLEILGYSFASISLSLGFSHIAASSLEALKALAKKRTVSSSRLLPLLAFGATVIYCTGRIEFFGISLSAMITVFLILLTIKLSEKLTAPLTIFLIGTYLISTSSQASVSLILCVCAALSATFKDYKRWIMPSAFALSTAMLVLITKNDIMLIAEALLACAAFIVLPRSFHSKIEFYSKQKSNAAYEAKLLLLQEKLLSASKIICSLAKMFSLDNKRLFLANRCLFSSGKLMKKLSEEASVTQKTKRCTVDVGIASLPKAGNRETGDSLAISEYGIFNLLALSDGMGSGISAHNESKAALDLLCDLLSIGFELKEALECANIAMLEKRTSDMYATMDAVRINCSSMTAEFVKQGSPDSFIVRDDRVIKISTEALPIGILEEAKPSLYPIKLCRGDIIFLMTDGMSEAMGHRIIDMLSDVCMRLSSPSSIADELIYTARALSDCDDITVIVAKIV
ncbi:MAG: SpoIIE family protein phosphatase [Clostridia bacterium]|nr:SpoIIE family protein phosphatase [Clostridia bacterium]